MRCWPIPGYFVYRIQNSDTGVTEVTRRAAARRAAMGAGFAALLLATGAAADTVPDMAHREDVVGRVETLAATPGPHWIWVLDANLGSMPDGRAYLFDGDTGASFGTLNTGYSFITFALPRAYDAIYSPETYYSRHARGTRTDIVSVYDPRTLSTRVEIPLPAKRASTIPRLHNAALTDDDHFLAVFNLTPATSLSIVDTRAGTFVAEIPIPGCSLAFAAGPRALFSLCFNGGALVTYLKEDGTLDRQARVDGIFDAEGDFIADTGARLGDSWLFPSVEGNVYALVMEAGGLKARGSWSLLTEDERADHWRISGFQGSAVHGATGRLFVLLHRGAVDTYKDPGTEVWIYDVARRARVGRIALEHPAMAIAVSQDEDAVFAALDMMGRQLDLYRAADGTYLRTIAETGMTPTLLMFPWQPPAPER